MERPPSWIDTHDYGDILHPVEKNNVFTVEPGIYILRGLYTFEDDVVVMESGDPINLMKNIPIEIDEIEYLMNLK